MDPVASPDDEAGGVRLAPHWGRPSHPDLPLRLDYEVAPDAPLDCIVGLRNSEEAAVARLLIDAGYEAHLSQKRGVSYSRTPEFYASARRAGCITSHGVTMRVVEHLERCGVIEHHRAKPQPQRSGANQRSWFCLRPDLLVWLIERGGPLGEWRTLKGPLVRMRQRSAGGFLPVPQTEQIRAYTRDMTLINEAATNAAWQPSPHHVVSRRGDLMVLDSAGRGAWLNAGTNGYLLFLVADPARAAPIYARMHGWPIHRVPKAIRRAGEIEGGRLQEIDFNSLHPRLVLIRAGMRACPGEDIYGQIANAANQPRALVKPIVLISLNARTRAEARRAAACKVAMDGRRLGCAKSDFATADCIFDCMASLYPPLADQVGMDAGVHLMMLECEIVRAACLDLSRKGIPVIPLHDALIVSATRAGAAEEAMETASYEKLGTALPTTRLWTE